MTAEWLADLRRNPRATRAFAHGIMLASVLGVVVTFLDGGVGGWPLAAWLLAYLSATLALELALRTEKGFAFSGGDYQEVTSRLGSAATLIAASNGVDILSGTLRTFAERRADIHALHVGFIQGRPVRILIMHPTGAGAHAIADERRRLGRQVSAADLGDDIGKNVRRLLLEFSPVELSTVLRYYTHAPHSSVHRYGELFVATLYTVGRGSSSRCIAVRRSDHPEFCESLNRGFDELWHASETNGPDVAELEALAHTES